MGEDRDSTPAAISTFELDPLRESLCAHLAPYATGTAAGVQVNDVYIASLAQRRHERMLYGWNMSQLDITTTSVLSASGAVELIRKLTEGCAESTFYAMRSAFPQVQVQAQTDQSRGGLPPFDWQTCSGVISHVDTRQFNPTRLLMQSTCNHNLVIFRPTCDISLLIVGPPEGCQLRKHRSGVWIAPPI